MPHHHHHHHHQDEGGEGGETGVPERKRGEGWIAEWLQEATPPFQTRHPLCAVLQEDKALLSCLSRYTVERIC